VFGDDVRANLNFAKAFHTLDYMSSQKVRTFALEIFHEIFSKVDVMITPATGVVAPAIDPIALNGEMITDTSQVKS
jgi:hypothetical protein